MPEPAVNSLHTFQMDIVHGCQLRCVGCPNSTIMDKVQRIDPEHFRACLANVDVSFVKHFRLFNFGEPLLHHNLAEIFAIIAEQPWTPEETEISTNAQWCDWDDLEQALAMGVLDRLVVSCDGDGTPEAYERLRPPSKWDKLLEFLERAADIQQRVAPDLNLITRTIVEDEDAMRRWDDVLLSRGWTPEYRDWKILPEAQENRTGRDLL
ncbi:MAG: radical SAM protein, partial [Halioglobus sp.]|nr:radical SAM protein [Halioglobus sp.]